MTLVCRCLVVCCLVLAAVVALTAGPVRLVRAQAEVSKQSPSVHGAPETQRAYSLPRAKLAKAIAYSRINHILGFAGALWNIGVLWLLLASGAAARLDAWARRTAPEVALHGLLFFGLLIVITQMAEIPLGWYGHRVSVLYGVGVEGWGSWFANRGKAILLTLMISAPLFLLFHWTMRRSPKRYWIWVWLISLPVAAFGAFAAPIGDRIFNRYEPLAKTNPALVTELEKVVARTGTDIPPERMFVMKAGEKTNGLNAYVTGLGATKRIVVWDTTIERIPEDEILYIFAHESGHYVLNHFVWGLTIAAVGFLLVLRVSARVAEWLIGRYGHRWRIEGLGSMAGLVVLLFAMGLVSLVAEPVGNAFSRHLEHEADVYGLEAIHGIVPDPQKTAVRAMNDLGEAWLDDPDPNPFLEFWSYNHPSIQHRAQFAAGYDPWANGGHGEFFKK
jgi:Zn-dependent protease with chaperone function